VALIHSGSLYVFRSQERLRQERSRPLIVELQVWLRKQRAKFSDQRITKRGLCPGLLVAPSIQITAISRPPAAATCVAASAKLGWGDCHHVISRRRPEKGTHPATAPVGPFWTSGCLRSGSVSDVLRTPVPGQEFANALGGVIR
jgi:hypothetical protein